MNVTLAPRVFLSASVPLPSRNAVYFNTADVMAIRDAVRALTMVIIEEKMQLVFGGHPAISPMIRLQISQTGSPVGERVIMYQSRYFDRIFPDDNAAFEHVELVDDIRLCPRFRWLQLVPPHAGCLMLTLNLDANTQSCVMR